MGHPLYKEGALQSLFELFNEITTDSAEELPCFRQENELSRVRFT